MIGGGGGDAAIDRRCSRHIAELNVVSSFGLFIMFLVHKYAFARSLFVPVHRVPVRGSTCKKSLSVCVPWSASSTNQPISVKYRRSPWCVELGTAVVSPERLLYLDRCAPSDGLLAGQKRRYKLGRYDDATGVTDRLPSRCVPSVSLTAAAVPHMQGLSGNSRQGSRGTPLNRLYNSQTSR